MYASWKQNDIYSKQTNNVHTILKNLVTIFKKLYLFYLLSFLLSLFYFEPLQHTHIWAHRETYRDVKWPNFVTYVMNC